MTNGERRVLDEWTTGFHDRDGKFVIEFQTTFNSCFWELYLNATFRSLGFTPDFTHASPDFLCSNDRSAFVAEAAIASHADGHAAEWEATPGEQISPERKRAMLEYSSVRLSNALDGKLRKYRSSYASLPHVADKPFVVCLAPFEQPLSFALADRPLRRLLYCVDVPVYEDDEATNQRVVWGETSVERSWKESSAEVPFGLFRDGRAAEVSAVIFSSVATFGKVQALAPAEREAWFFALRYNDNGLQPSFVRSRRQDYEETLADGLHLFLNPHASRPLDPAPFLGREIAVHYGFDEKLGTVRSHVPNGFLFSRSVMALGSMGAEGAREQFVHTGPRGRIPSPIAWPEDKLHPVGGQVGTFADNHLAHYKGWTILVVRDEVDKDWSAQACAGIYRDVASWIDGQRQPETKSLISLTWFPQRDEAWMAIKKQIDEAEAG